ncbi:hypothetical protein VTI74DRAFT_6172 [Chaetomium olivicolor]
MASTIDINCPLNTTECIFQAVVALLDQVREQNAQFDWDPLSFVFTAVTGVAAACFAAITIVQALFAAGPGRLKSSRYAIGPWAKFTRHYFDRQEWRFRSVAQTPVIVFSSQDGLGDQHKHFITKSSEYQPAGWNALLSHLRLNKPEFWGRKLTGADHLPQELSAVPAYGNIAAIITLAIAQAGGHCEMVPDQDSQFLMVRGDAFQLRMRKHAVLGTVATFEIYPNPRPPPTQIALIRAADSRAAPEQIALARFSYLGRVLASKHKSTVGDALYEGGGHLHVQIRHSLGYVPLDTGRIYQSPDEAVKGLGWLLLVEPEDCAPGAFTFPTPSTTPDQRQAQRQIIMDYLKQTASKGQADQSRAGQSRCRTGVYQSPDCCGCYESSSSSPEESNNQELRFQEISRLAFESRCPLGLMISSPLVILDQPAVCPIVGFPSRQAELHWKSQILVLQSRFWSRGATVEVVPSTFSPSLLSHWEFPTDAMEQLVNWSDIPADTPPGTFVLIREAYKHCVRFLETGAAGIRSPSTDIQVCLATQLALVDRWLRHNAPVEKMCRQVTLSTVTTLMHNILRDNMPLPPAPPAPDGTSRHRKQYPAINEFALPILHEKLQTIIHWFEWCCDKLDFSVDSGTATSGKIVSLLEGWLDPLEPAAAWHRAFLPRVKEVLFDRELILRRLLGSRQGKMNAIQRFDMYSTLLKIASALDPSRRTRASALLKDELGTRSSLDDILLLLYKAIRIWELEEPTQTIDGLKKLVPEPTKVLMMGDNFVIPPEDLHPLDDLIIYRALLMATLLSLPVDTSPLLNNEMYQQVVPFL